MSYDKTIGKTDKDSIVATKKTNYCLTLFIGLSVIWKAFICGSGVGMRF